MGKKDLATSWTELSCFNCYANLRQRGTDAGFKQA